MNYSIIKSKIIRNVCNLLGSPKNLIFRVFNLPLKPRWVVFMVTDRCNSRCSHCNIWHQKPIDNPLTPDEIEKIFKDPFLKNVEYVLCTGGEPTLRDDLVEIFLRLHRALPKATLQLSTNALLPERVINLVNKAMEQGINLDVGVSLDGIGEVHDKIRGVPGNFEKADWLIHELIKIRDKYKNKLKISAGIVVSDLTVNSIDQVREYAQKLQIDLVEAWYNICSFYKNYNESDKTKIKNKIIEIVKSQPFSPLQEKWLKHLEGKPFKFSCFAANRFFVLKCNGDIVPCLNLWDFKIGNVRESSIENIWKSIKAKEIRKVVKKCTGCLNSWAFWWSAESAYYPILYYYLKRFLLWFKKIFL